MPANTTRRNSNGQFRSSSNERQAPAPVYKNGEGYWKLVFALTFLVVGIAAIAASSAVAVTVYGCATNPITDPSLSLGMNANNWIQLPLATCRSPVIMMGMGIIVVLLGFLVIVYIILTHWNNVCHKQAQRNW